MHVLMHWPLVAAWCRSSWTRYVPQRYTVESAVNCVQLLLVMASYRGPGTSCWPPSAVGQDHPGLAPHV